MLERDRRNSHNRHSNFSKLISRRDKMAKPIFHSSIEGAQHGAKSLDEFLAFAKASGAGGAQPSNYMLQASDDGESFKSAQEIKDTFEKHGLKFDGISAHCPFWVHTSAWTGTKSGHPFIHAQNQDKSPSELEQWYEDYLLKLMLSLIHI